MRAVDHALAELAEALSWRSAGLTEREVDALRLVAIGLSNDDIARAPGGQPHIVHVHVRVLFAKLGVSTRTAAAHEASLLNLFYGRGPTNLGRSADTHPGLVHSSLVGGT